MEILSQVLIELIKVDNISLIFAKSCNRYYKSTEAVNVLSY